ncbi:chemotaxis protein CheD [Longimicrobium terrae]|uniref:Probable chemoreceptor glutamine deamidase CheD n=1 Tax=Longimicrobium terrae TaxID=1639882 RepID=A0A841H4D7_9BACT|nr:chemotaxis protein CheD [Longimicrobium terrae]MBB4638529.1 chemotaxis protein CheD [Longimicrobium terrae]MBB6072833.1 chemotaxis protein CheD [Longimicrobium terrae]NNC30550.1 chemotaxis protein CheD [Longimicrobium terrae]
MNRSNATYVKVAQHAVGGADDLLVTLGLGSCVAIMLHDADARVGGMAHVLLPEPALSRDRSNESKFASTAVPLLVQEMARRGARPGRLKARLVGGAAMFQTLMVPGSLNMGERNIRASREALHKAGIPILGEEVGGDYGRSVRFAIGPGTTIVSSVGRSDVAL